MRERIPRQFHSTAGGSQCARVQISESHWLNQRPRSVHLDQEIIERLQLYAGKPASEISGRIRQLEREWDIERRARLAGYGVRYVPEAVVEHDYRLSYSPAKAFYLGLGALIVLLGLYLPPEMQAYLSRAARIAGGLP